MKILHTADWHLGKRLDFFLRIEEQKEVIQEICEIAEAEDVDMVIVAGDLFDAFNPPVEATELLYQSLKRLTNNGKRPVIAIAGNHDSPDRIDSPDPLARACGIIFVGYPHAVIKPFQLPDSFEVTKSDAGFIELVIPHLPYPVRVISTAYANELRLKQYLGLSEKAESLNELLYKSWKNLADKYCDSSGVNILTAHLYMLKRGGEILEEPDGEKPIKIGNADVIYSDLIPHQIQYTALGHLHRYQNVGGHHAPVVYPSSPLPYSFSEAGQEKKVIIVYVEPNGAAAKYDTRTLTKGRKLYRKRFEQIDEAVEWLYANPYSLVELTLISDTFISSTDLKRIHESHDGIIHIIPVVKQQQLANNPRAAINLEQDMDDLFKDYFKNKYGQDPNSEILNLFKEVVTHTKETEE